MTSPNIIRLSNERVHIAISSVRVLGRDPSTMCEVRDALNARRKARTAGLTEQERARLWARYLATSAGH